MLVSLVRRRLLLAGALGALSLPSIAIGQSPDGNQAESTMFRGGPAHTGVVERQLWIHDLVNCLSTCMKSCALVTTP